MRKTAAMLAFALWGAAMVVPSVASPSRTTQPPVVIAIIESGGLNVLHEDFGGGPARGTTRVRGIPSRKMLRLPTTGSFEDRLEAAREGTLGHLQPGGFYGIEQTRIVGIYLSPDSEDRRDLFEQRQHPTGAASAAVGLEHGTNPDALLVFIPSADGASWDWLARQKWIDIVSTSYAAAGFSSDDPEGSTCEPAEQIRAITDQGRVVFSASGNAEQAGLVLAPSGVPESYQVGGVDDDGSTFVTSGEEDDVALTPTRPYETGDRFLFPAASADALRGSMPFGGTSGATPSTAGRAAELIQTARTLLGSSFTGVREGALAIARRNVELPAGGPLRDGRLTSDELVDILHRIAVPAEQPSPLRYLVEGYGALNDGAVELGKKVLAGTAELPDRSEEDAMHETVESGRSAVFSEPRCS